MKHTPKIISDNLPACARKLSPLEMNAIHFDLRRTLITADMLERERINTGAAAASQHSVE